MYNKIQYRKEQYRSHLEEIIKITIIQKKKKRTSIKTLESLGLYFQKSFATVFRFYQL